MKVLKTIFASVIVICLLVLLYAVFSFDGDSMTLTSAIILLCLSAIVGGVSFIGYLTAEKIIEDREEWQGLFKKN